jgi:hypothetical protein
MWRALICFCAGLLLAAPNFAHAQYADSDQQNPKEYRDEDSHPIRMIAYILSPIGFMLEWTIARPAHYVATDSFLAPVFGQVPEPTWTPPAIAEIPLDKIEEPAPLALPPTEVTPAPEAGASSHGALSAPAKPSAPIDQPVLH